MKICIAQTRPVKGDIDKNITSHIKFVERAADLNASAIFFLNFLLPVMNVNLQKMLQPQRMIHALKSSGN